MLHMRRDGPVWAALFGSFLTGFPWINIVVIRFLCQTFYKLKKQQAKKTRKTEEENKLNYRPGLFHVTNLYKLYITTMGP